MTEAAAGRSVAEVDSMIERAEMRLGQYVIHANRLRGAEGTRELVAHMEKGIVRLKELRAAMQ
jgi:hypothetical protein